MTDVARAATQAPVLAVATDPFAYTPPAGSRWSTRNVAEAIPGVPTPLSWSLWGPAMNGAAIGTFGRVGAFSRKERADLAARDVRTTALFYGRPAANVDFLGTAVGRMGQDPAEVERGYLGLEPGDDTPSRDLRRLPFLVVRTPAAVRGYRREARRQSAATEPWWRESTGRALTPDEATGVLRQSADRFAAIMEPHTFQSMLCAAAFGVVAKLAARRGLAGLETRLAGASADLEEFRIASDLWATSRGRLTVEGFVARYGFHGPNSGELSSCSWREDPTPVEVAVRSHAARDEARSPEAGLRRRLAERAEAERALLAGGGAADRALARAVLRWAAAEELRREVGKTTFLRCLDVARHAARAVGAGLLAEGRIGDADDIFFLTVAEIGDPPGELRTLVTGRRADRERHASLELPVLFTGDPTPIVTGMPVQDPGGRDPTIRGLAASAGRAVGRARVVLSAGDCDEPLDGDEILVTHTTDPSWVALFMTAGGLVIDVGGPLSHAAIISRSLGVPCVINTEDGTSRIPDGAWIRVDGDAGTVEILGERP